MLGRIVKESATKINVAGKRNLSRTPARMGGDGHHQHYVFEGEFPKGWVTGLSLFVVGGGISVPVLLCKYQNWKNGFPRDE